MAETENRALTFEQLEWLVKSREQERDKAREDLKAEREENKLLRLVLRGMVEEHFTLKVHIDPLSLMNEKMWDAVQFMLRNYCRQTAHEIEQKIGGPIRELQEALMHINYLENHASRSGLSFTPWGWKDLHRGLLY